MLPRRRPARPTGDINDSFSESFMVALGIIFGFIALYGILNLIEFKRFD